MQVLDKAVFKQTLSLLALRIPCKKTGLFLTQLKPHLLNWPRLPNVVVDPRDKAHRLLLLNERIKESDLSDLPSEAAKFIRDQNAEVVAHELTLNYDYFTAEQILRKVLPSEYEIPSAFETVGHIAHLNLKEYHLPYKHVIGQVILDKNRPKIKTVVNKVHNIISPFRVFDMEVLAGEPDFNVEVVCRRFTFSVFSLVSVSLPFSRPYFALLDVFTTILRLTVHSFYLSLFFGWTSEKVIVYFVLIIVKFIGIRDFKVNTYDSLVVLNPTM
jgi:hypothetical protein